MYVFYVVSFRVVIFIFFTSVVVPQCCMLICPCVYGINQYGHLNNSYPLCFLFSSVFCNLKKDKRPQAKCPPTCEMSVCGEYV